MKTRIHFLDNLRSFLIFMVVLYHASIVFQPGFENDWIVSDNIKSNFIGLIGLYGDTFAMFLLFFISGFFMPNSIYNKSISVIILTKFKRIMIPWLVAVLTLIPAYKAIFLYSRGLPQEEWFSYFHIFKRAGADPEFFANDPTQHWLWFLPALFLFQVLYSILARTRLLSINITLKKAILITFFVALIYSMIISSLDMRGWTYTALLDFQRERLLIYFMVFLLGSLSFKLKVFDYDKRNKKYLIISNVVLTLAITLFTIVALNLFLNLVYPDRHHFFVSKHVDVTTYYISLLLCMFSFMYVLLDLFKFNINKNNKFWDLLNRNSYLIYIIHMIVLGGFALPLSNLSYPVFIKFPILGVMTFIGSTFIAQGLSFLIQKLSYKDVNQG